MNDDGSDITGCNFRGKWNGSSYILWSRSNALGPIIFAFSRINSLQSVLFLETSYSAVN